VPPDGRGWKLPAFSPIKSDQMVKDSTVPESVLA